MSEQTPSPTPEGPLSPDGQYRWDGSQWQAVQAPPPSPGAPQPPVAGAPLVPTPVVKKKGHTGRNILLGIVGLIVLLIIIGVASGGSKSTTSPSTNHSPSPFTSPSPLTSPLPQATAPAPVAPPAAPPPAALTVRITSSTYGHVAASTTAGATCTATATLPSGRTSTAAGLQVSMTAGANGVVAWDYRTTANTGKGTGTHTVSCQFNGQSASGSAPFTV